VNNDLTVIIPTYNRLSTLRLCLESLQNQTYKNFNVIIVDDGSSAEVVNALEEIERSSPLAIRVLYQQNAGPARARNLAISHASTQLSFLIGDDILPDAHCVEVHHNFHRSRPETAVVALGWTKWDAVHQKVTPFMKWYEEIQFDYEKLRAGFVPTFQHFYTSNLSFKTSLFRENPFNEQFKAAAWEDIELGFRLFAESKISLTFLEGAVATHIHPTTFLQAARRMQTLGRNERLFHQLWPTARGPMNSDLKAKICALIAQHPALLKVLTVVTANLGARLKPTKLHAMLLRSHQQVGYLADVKSHK
jgi:GT2 family glycosyltransferase